MKLLFFIHSLHAGGAERVTANLANHWAARGWQVTVVTLTSAAQDSYGLAPSVRRVGLDVARQSPNAVAAMAGNLARARALRRVLREVRPDVALAMMSSANILLALASPGLRGTVTLGSEHIHPPMMPMSRAWEFLRARLYGRLDAVVALTGESALWLRRHTSARLIPVIANAVPWPMPSQPPVLDPPPRTLHQRMLLAVGRLDRQKGFDLLIQAFQHLAPAFPQWQLSILGEGPLRGELEVQIEAAGLAGRIALCGRAGNVGEWYEAADLYVMSSRFEGFPNTLVEAMAHGLPAVSFDCDTGPRDIIRHGHDGLLVPDGDVAALGAALSRLMGNEAERRQCGLHAVEARERFSMQRIAGAWERLFEELRHAG